MSEGSSEEKRRAIRSSDCLDYVFNTFSEMKDALVVFGQRLGSQDHHLIQAIRRAPDRHIAFGVHATTEREVDRQREYVSDLFPEATVRFFDTGTHPLGDPGLLVG